MITTSFPHEPGGEEAAGSFVVDFSRELSIHANIAVVAPGPEEIVETDAVHGFPIYRYRAPLQPLSLLKPGNPRHWKSIATTLLSGRRMTRRAAAQLEAEIFLALWALPSGYWAKSATKVCNAPYAIWALGSDIWSLGKIPLVRRFLGYIMAEARYRFADGYQLLRDVEKISGRPCKFLPSARQLPACGIGLTHKPPYRLAFLGRWHPNKGIDLLLEALGLLGENDWSRIESVRIAGGGPLENLVVEKIQALTNMGRPILLEGYKDLHAATELLLWSDLIVIPSRIESIPVIFSDALQARRRILATPVGDFPRLAQEKEYAADLTLSETASAASLAHSLHSLLHESEWLPPERMEQSPIKAAVKTFLDDTLPQPPNELSCHDA